jgi:UPF0042 nucleotide-binding protein
VSTGTGSGTEPGTEPGADQDTAAGAGKTTDAPGVPDAAIPELVIISGMSGAGRSTAAKCLEDLGWFVVDNLPPALIPTMVELGARSQGNVARIAVVVDVRGRRFFDNLRQSLADLEAKHVTRRIVFLESSDEALVRRFESVRRPHPLQGSGRILDGIHEERTVLAELRSTAETVIDSTRLNIHQLSTAVADAFGDPEAPVLRVALMSFGFKYGLPLDADHVADVRFIPNPYWIPGLRARTGLDEPVRDFVLGQDGVDTWLERYAASLEPVLRGYRRENKRHVTVAIGCTGGKHRSVALAEALAQRLAEPDVAVSALHRDLGRE